MKKLCLVPVMLCSLFPVFCQFPEINFERISVQQGLADNSIFNILQDDKGFIWLGSEHGLYRHDGYGFTFIKNLPGGHALKSVYSIKEDSLGIIWILSDIGISIYDPEKERSNLLYSFEVDSIGWNYVTNPTMLRDSRGNIWACNHRGLIKFSKKEKNPGLITREKIFSQSFTDIYDIEFIDLSAQKDGNDNSIGAIYEDHSGNIWVGCVEGIYLLRTNSSKFLRLDKGANLGNMKPVKFINSIIEFNHNEYWIATLDGMYILSNVSVALRDSIPDISSLHFTLNKIQTGQLTLVSNKRKNVLLGGEKGIFILKKDTIHGNVNFEALNDGPIPIEEIGTNNSVQNLFEDRSGVLWAARSNNGVSKTNLVQTQFTSYNNIAKKYFKSSDINSILKDKKNNLWIGTWGAGLYKIQSGNNRITQFDLGPFKNDVVCINEVSPDLFWIGTYRGIITLNSQSAKTADPMPNTTIANILRNTKVWDILADGDNVYIASTNGFFIYNLLNRQLYNYTNNNERYSNDDSFSSFSLLKTRNGEIIVGTGRHGINKISFNIKTGIITMAPVITQKQLVKHEIDISGSHRLYEDKEGFLWVTDNTGLHRIDIKKGEFKNFKLFENFAFPEVWSIVEDNHRNLWLGTHNGLCRFNIDTKAVKTFNKSNGLPVLVHGLNSVYKDSKGRLYFGGLGGFYSFHPDSLKTNDFAPPIVITDFRLFNKSLKTDTSKGSILRKNISYSRLIELRYNQNDISFQFAALDYNQPLKNKYSYRLIGYQKEWIETDAKNRTATYTNLDPGTYTFQVRGSNNDGFWNEKGASITIIIYKPWWNTILAWIIYVLVFVGVTGVLIYRRLWLLKKEKQLLEKQVHERTRQIEEQKGRILLQMDKLEEQNQKITELDELKSRFFTNISHEFRTPLSLIQSPVEELLEDPRRNEKERRKLNLVQRNTQRLLNLVNQLLDISKIDGSKMKLDLVEADVMKHLSTVAGNFSSLAETKSINYRMHLPKEELKTWFDPDKLDKIAINLLSNAFKFTPEGGEVTFNASYKFSGDKEYSQILEFSVKDTGMGIPAKNQEKVFDRFYQVESSLKKEGGGTGIGLSLSKELAHLMHGDITIKSENCEGSTFNFMCPLGKDHLEESEFTLLNDLPESFALVPELYGIMDIERPEQIAKSAPILLIVEDNVDIRIHLTENLNRDYNIYEAIDGVSALKKAIELIPDLIITDLMMPRMDGMELCEKLKNDERTSHIPIIMLTAKVSLEDKTSGLLLGADDYIAKPFNLVELRARIKNLIEQRKSLRERFSREITLEPTDISITPMDEKFLKRAIETVENHINEEEFDLSEFRQEMNMSRSTLFRKLHALTGQSPTEFIRTIRLKRAASLLKQNFGNVTQVSLEVGFSNLSYFNRTFKKLFGVSPVEYTKVN